MILNCKGKKSTVYRNWHYTFVCEMVSTYDIVDIFLDIEIARIRLVFNNCLRQKFNLKYLVVGVVLAEKIKETLCLRLQSYFLFACSSLF